MKFKKTSLLLCVVLLFALVGCATVTQDQALTGGAVLPPKGIKNATDKSWGFSQPVAVPPRVKSVQEGEEK